MVSEWQTLSLREGGVTLIDCDHRTPPAAESGYPYVAIPQLKQGRIDLTNVRRISHEHFFEWTKKANPKPYDVVLSRRCNPGETAFVPSGLEFALGQNLVLLRTDGTKVFPPFLRWLVCSPAWWEQVNTFINVGAIFDSLKCADIPNFRLPLPPYKEQKAIAAILGEFDDKIELNCRMNATLEAMAQALFKSWFVDFDPVKAKAAGRAPEGMDADTAALFPGEFVESKLGLIPKGWAIKTISELWDINNWTLRNADLLDRIKYIEISAVSKGNISEIVEYERGSEPSRAKRRLKHGDTVLSTVRPDRGAYFLCLNPSETLIASTGFAVVSPRREDWAFIHAALTLDEVFETLGHLADGGAYPAVRPEVIGNLQLSVPDEIKISNVFHQIVAPLYERAETNRIESHRLGAIRDALLPKFISGQLRIPEAEAMV